MKLSTLRHGNCLFGLLLILWSHLRRGRWGRIHVRWNRDTPPVPHAYFECPKGVFHHYRFVSPLWEDPWAIYWFVGRFAKTRRLPDRL